MKIKIATATNTQLNWLTAKCESLCAPAGDKFYWQSMFQDWWKYGGYGDGFNYTTNWEQGGPIIELEGLQLRKFGNEWQSACWNESTLNFDTSYGPTPLVAAMRCYITSKLGDEAEIPEELK